MVKLQVEMWSWSSWFCGTNHDWKTRNSFYKLVFALSEVVFVRRLTVQHSLPPSWLDMSCFRLKWGHFLMNLQFEVIFWLPRFCHPNHDWKLNIHFENGCLHPKGFDFVWRLHKQHSSQISKLHLSCFRSCHHNSSASSIHHIFLSYRVTVIFPKGTGFKMYKNLFRHRFK